MMSNVVENKSFKDVMDCLADNWEKMSKAEQNEVCMYISKENIKRPLIRKLDKTLENIWKEPTYEDFVSRTEFINRTGIFVTPEHFSYIYDYDFKESGLTCGEFIQNIEDLMDGQIIEMSIEDNFRFFIMDDEISCINDYESYPFEEWHDPNIYELLNCLVLINSSNNESKQEIIEKYKNVVERAVELFEKACLLEDDATILN